MAHSKQVNKENLMKRLFAKVQAALQYQQRMPKHPELASAGGTCHAQAGGWVWNKRSSVPKRSCGQLWGEGCSRPTALKEGGSLVNKYTAFTLLLISLLLLLPSTGAIQTEARGDGSPLMLSIKTFLPGNSLEVQRSRLSTFTAQVRSPVRELRSHKPRGMSKKKKKKKLIRPFSW